MSTSQSGDNRPANRGGSGGRGGSSARGSSGQGGYRGNDRSSKSSTSGRPRRDNSSFGERKGKRYDGTDRRRGGERGPFDSSARTERPVEPTLPEDIQASDLDPEVRRDLRSLDKNNAEAVSRHLVAAMYLIDEDPQAALAHGHAAKNRASRIGVVRETVGVLAYRAGEWAEALGELRAARRILGGPGLLPLIADCERGLGRPERAIEAARGGMAEGLTGADLTELRIVEAGARVDMDQLDAALVTLEDAGLDSKAKGEEAARLDYAYAEVLLAAERIPEARTWFAHAVEADLTGEATDAEERLAQLGG